MAKQSALDLECTELRKRVSARDDEVARLQDTIEDQAASIDNLNVSDELHVDRTGALTP